MIQYVMLSLPRFRMHVARIDDDDDDDDLHGGQRSIEVKLINNTLCSYQTWSEEPLMQVFRMMMTFVDNLHGGQRST